MILVPILEEKTNFEFKNNLILYSFFLNYLKNNQNKLSNNFVFVHGIKVFKDSKGFLF